MNRILMFVALALCSSLAGAEDIKLEPQVRSTLGIETVTPAAADLPHAIGASAQVLDPAPLIALIGDLKAAQLTATSSASELVRLERLHADDANASLKSVQAARAQAAADNGRLATLRAQLAASWGRALANFDDKEQAHLLDELAAGRISLLRADLAEPVAPQIELREAQVRSLNDEENWSAAVLGRAAQGNDRGIGAAYLLKVAADLQPNRMLHAELIDRKHPERGTKIPRSALLRWQGSDWVFIEVSENTFARQIVHPLRWLDDACLVKEMFAPEQKIVATGVMMLLGMEGASAQKSGAKED